MKPHAVSILVLIAGCNFSRPDQDNFTIHAPGDRAEQMVKKLSRDLDASVEIQDLNGLGNEPTRMFWLDGRKVDLVITPVPDDRCDTNAPFSSTFTQGEFRIDLVYGTASDAARNSARRALIHAAQSEDLKITAFKEC